MRPLPLALLLLLTAATAHAAPSTPLTPVQRGPEAQALRQIEATRPLPGASFSAVKVTGRQDLYFVSADGRILIKGTAYDLWSGQTLSTIEDVAEATTRINLDGFAAIWPQLDPIELGQGPNTVVAFVAPGCPHCQSLIEQAQGLLERYRFLLLPIPAFGRACSRLRRNRIRLAGWLLVNKPTCIPRTILTRTSGGTRLRTTTHSHTGVARHGFHAGHL